MNEQFLATFGQNLYPEHRGGKVVLEEASSEESQRSLEDRDGEKRVRERERQATEKGRRGEKQGKGKSKKEVQEARRREEEEAEKLRELKEMLEKTAPGAEESMKRAKSAATEAMKPHYEEERAGGLGPLFLIEASDGKKIVVDEVEVHYENLSRSGAAEKFEEKGIQLSENLPEEWNKWSIWDRRRWLLQHGLVETMKFHQEGQASELEEWAERGEVEEAAKIKLGDKLELVLYKKNDGRYVIGDVGEENLTSENLKRLFKEAKLRVKFPKNFDKLLHGDKLQVLEEEGVEISQALRPVGHHWRDIGSIDLRTALSRLDELRNQEATDPVSFAREHVGHRSDLYGRMNQIGGWQNISLQDSFSYLIEIERIRSGTGMTPDLEISRQQLHRNLIQGITGEREMTPDYFSEAVRAALYRRGSPDLTDHERVLINHFDFIVGQFRTRSAGDGNYSNFRMIHNFLKAVEAYENMAKRDADLSTRLDNNLNMAHRTRLKGIRDYIHRHFEDLDTELKAKNPDVRKKLVIPLDDTASTAKGSKKIGMLASFQDVEARIWSRVRQEMGSAPSDELRQYVEWYGTNLYELTEKQMLEEGDLGAPVNWKDSLNNVNNNLRLVEASDLPVEQLQQAIGRIVQITENMSISKLSGTEREEAEKMRNEIQEIKAAVEALYVLRQTMESSSMNPEKVAGVFERPQWTDRAYKDYFKRFEKDTRGGEFKDTSGNTFNLLDKSMQLYFRKFREERRDMNLIEGLTVVDIDRAFTRNDSRTRTIETLLGRRLDDDEKDRLEILRQNFLDRLTDLRRTKPDAGWRRARNIGTMKDIVNAWLREETLLGAHGFGPDGKTRYLDLRKFGNRATGDIGLRDQLEDYLRDNLDVSMRGVDIGKLIDEYKQAGLIDQVINNAYYMTWMWGAFSEFSFVRIWDTDKEWFVDDRGFKHPRLGGYAYNQDSRIWYGRMVDTYPEFLLDERRGKPGIGKDLDANFVFQRNMVGRTKGILNHNRLLSKMVVDNLVQDDNFKNSLVYDPAGRGVGSYDRVVHERAVRLDGIDKLNIGELNAKHEGFDGGREYDQNWARGVAVVELMEEGKLSLENIEWSKVFTHPDANISMYNMADWWDDRQQAARYFGARQTAFQKYMQQPNTKTFLELNSIDLFYSGREPRIKSWMKLAIPAHIDLGRYWKKWWKLEDKMYHSEKEDIIDIAVRSNALDERDVDNVKRKYLGWDFTNVWVRFPRGRLKLNIRLPGNMIVRNTREYLEVLHYFARETGKQSWTWPFIMFGEFWKQLTKYLGGAFAS